MYTTTNLPIEVLEFKPSVKFNRTGFVKVLYGFLEMTCEVRIRKDKSAVWIKMPQALSLSNNYYNSCHWPSKIVSDEFQRLVLEKLSQQFPDAMKVPSKRDIYLSRTKPKTKPLNFDNPPPPKARSHSKFL